MNQDYDGGGSAAPPNGEAVRKRAKRLLMIGLRDEGSPSVHASRDEADRIIAALAQPLPFGAADIYPAWVRRPGGVLEIRKPMSSASERMQDDVRALMEALGIPTHARDASPHEVIRNEVLPAVRALRNRTIEECADVAVGALDSHIAEEIRALKHVQPAARQSSSKLVKARQSLSERLRAAVCSDDCEDDECKAFREAAALVEQPPHWWRRGEVVCRACGWTGAIKDAMHAGLSHVLCPYCEEQVRFVESAQ